MVSPAAAQPASPAQTVQLQPNLPEQPQHPENPSQPLWPQPQENPHLPRYPTNPPSSQTPGARGVHQQEKAGSSNKNVSLSYPPPLSQRCVLVKSLYQSVQSHSCQVGIGWYQFSFCQIGANEKILNKFVIKPDLWSDSHLSLCGAVISIQPWFCPVKVH